MTDGLKAVAGDSLRAILARFTGGPVTAVMTGVAITLVVQWSSATVLMTIGFVSAGLLTFAQSVGVIFGANLGTTSTGWLVALPGLHLSISAVALPLVGSGALARLPGRGRTASMGLVVAGFGLIFVRIDYLQAGMNSFSQDFGPSMLPGATIAGRLLLVGIRFVSRSTQHPSRGGHAVGRAGPASGGRVAVGRAARGDAQRHRATDGPLHLSNRGGRVRPAAADGAREVMQQTGSSGWSAAGAVYCAGL